MADAPSLLVELTTPQIQLQFAGGVNPKGEYNAATAYSLGDSVSYNGSSYAAIQATTGNLPTDTTYWQVLASKGDTGETGETGATGATGPTGANAYVYIAYASDASGTGFTMTFNAALNYIAVRNTTVEIPSPQASDFAGLWKNYKGEGGIPVTDAGGTVDAVTADYSPDVSLADKTMVAFVALGANTSTTPTFAPDGLTAHTIVKYGGQALAAGDIKGAGMVCIVEYNAANTRWELLNPVPSTSVYPPGHFDGFAVSNGTDADHDLDIAAGTARDSADGGDIVAAAMTKQADATWASGTNAGGMASGESLVMEKMILDVAPGGSGWAVGDTITGVSSGQTCKIIQVIDTLNYYVKNRSGAFTLGEVLTNGTNTADQGASYPTFTQVGTSINVWAIDGQSVTGDYLINNAYDSGLSPTLPAGYTLKRLISSWRVNSSGNIINGFWWGTGREREFTYNTPIMAIVINNPGTSAMTTTLETPYGISVRASFVLGGENTGPYYPSSLAGTDMAPSATVAPYNVGNSQTANKVSNITNTLSQIRCRCGSSASGEYFRLQTDGWTQAF